MENPPRLTAEQREKIKRHLDHWNIPTCPFCGSNKWFIGEHLVQPLTVSARGMPQAGGVGYPQAMIISEPCGYTVFFNAVALGIMAKDDDKGSA